MIEKLKTLREKSQMDKIEKVLSEWSYERFVRYYPELVGPKNRFPKEVAKIK